MSWILVLFLGVISLSENGWCEKHRTFNYGFEANSIVNLRSKRQSRTSQQSTTTPTLASNLSESEASSWRRKDKSELANDKERVIDYAYYEVSTLQPSEASFNEHYLDILAMLKMTHVKGSQSHPQLTNSYRRGVSTKISFEFPFYGQRMKTLTIATGGFCHIGDKTHDWLGATQYIAPLMANFDTSLPNATVMYADNGTVFVIEWSRVQLRDDPNAGNFTFQLSLHKNGDIWFVYKEVPVAVELISDAVHPRKLGTSDAYWLVHRVLMNSTGHRELSIPLVHEYHRIEVDSAKVKSKTVVIFKALPTCIALTTCHACANAALKHFNCSWCQGKEEASESFCSDEDGLNRRRQDWVSGNCKQQNRIMNCNNEDQDQHEKQLAEDKVTNAREPESSPDAPQAIPRDANNRVA